MTGSPSMGSIFFLNKKNEEFIDFSQKMHDTCLGKVNLLTLYIVWCLNKENGAMAMAAIRKFHDRGYDFTSHQFKDGHTIAHIICMFNAQLYDEFVQIVGMKFRKVKNSRCQRPFDVKGQTAKLKLENISPAIDEIFSIPQMASMILPGKYSTETFSTYVIGKAANIGKRQYMEDTYFIESFEDDLCLGVFDGHGGTSAAVTAAEMFPMVLSQEIKENPKTSLSQSVKNTYLYVGNCLSSDKSGATAAVAIVRNINGKKTVNVSNIGDSRVILIDKHGKATRLSRDHKPGNFHERDRIIKSGGHVYHKLNGVPRVDGIAVSRAFGDCNSKHIICEPYQNEVDIKDDDMLLVVVSDGITDAYGDGDLGIWFKNKMIKHNIIDRDSFRKNIPVILEKLLTECDEKSDDNKTVIVASLHHFSDLTPQI